MSKHFEGLGDKWTSLLANPPQELPQMIPLVIDKGVTRESWRQVTAKKETVLMVWPQDAPLRSCVTLQGKSESDLQAVSVLPFMDGLLNDMTVEEVRPWKSETAAYVAASRNEGAQPIWFHTPLYYRDKGALTPGVRHTFNLAALAYGIRRALLDEMTITEGPQYEAYAEEWLRRNPESTRLDVPQLVVSLDGARILMPDEHFGDYQLRVPIDRVEETSFGPQKVYILYTRLGVDTPNPLELVVYAPENVCKGITPEAGDEIDALIWMQARIVD